MNIDRLKRDLRRHEGVRSKPYQDNLGVWTVGVGRNMNNGFRPSEIEMLFENDLLEAERAAMALVPMFRLLDHHRQEVLVNMAFNMGQTRLGRFRRMLDAIDRLDFEAAADEMLASTWAAQVGKRAVELAERMRLGASGERQV